MYIRENSFIESLLNNIEKNTNNNQHSENVMLIVSNYGTDVQKEECYELLQHHLKEGSLSSITSTARKYLLKDVLNNMDKSLSKAINSKL
jgi:cobalamin biosynthesis Co2+ chelatase CbiK